MSNKAKAIAECFSELDLTVLTVTETWLKDGRDIENNAADFEMGTGIAMIHRGRRERRGGGVAILYKKSAINLKKLTLNGNKYDILAASGKMQNNTRKVVIFCIYGPPNMRRSAWDELIECLVNNIMRIKTEMSEPYVVLTGDFNKHPLDQLLLAIPDLKIHSTPRQEETRPSTS